MMIGYLYGIIGQKQWRNRKNGRGMMMNKNDLINVTITDLGDKGEGIGHVDGMTVFVKKAGLGDVVEAKVIKVKKNYCIGKLENILSEGAYRINAVCPYADRCGGCQLQHMSYKGQLLHKQTNVVNTLKRIGGVSDVVKDAVLGMEKPEYYRNKGIFPVALQNGKPVIGFYRQGSHDVVDIKHCMLQSRLANRTLDAVRNGLKQTSISIYDEVKHKGYLRSVMIRTNRDETEAMVVFVTNGKVGKGLRNMIDHLSDIPEITAVIQNVNTSKGNKVLGYENHVVIGEGSITDYINEFAFDLGPMSFFQVNPVQTGKLYAQALAYADLKGEETVYDLYCGAGTISLFLAKQAKEVIGIEIIPEAVEAAKENAKRNGIDNTSFYVGKAEEVFPKLYEEGKKADVVVVDPPRKGCDELLLRTIADMKPDRIVYVSCKVSTLARDIKILEELGYETVKGQAVDMFPYTTHVENVVKLQLVNR